MGNLIIWSIIQEKKASKDIGKAFWSKLKLEKYQTINITEHIDTTIKDNTHFNLNSAKRRISQRKQEKSLLKKDTFRPKTATTFDFDIDRPYSAASLRKKVLPAEINLPKSWENGIVCSDLKIVSLNNVYSFLVAKNCGEVLCCKRCLGVVRGLPYFLAASDAGTVSLCSLLDSRVLLALDCRNVPAPLVDKCEADFKGRFVSSVSKSAVNFSSNEVLSKSSPF
ncbi:ABC-type Nod factor export system ATP binding protein NodI [Operophtera brumata]|uniref:ABC-type Nod factor export system ATP binding protein NodI n=1 Tax=Operophtera brumata TaxID=104452 RepID=A0A0L7KBL2_OPEBR|nr:ABC-type Nod factor export system ATP binding protein NodI [Operophtera brumata]